MKAVKENKFTGSSTACLAKLDEKTDILESINLGDSGYRVFRRSDEGMKLVYATVEQQHEFNFPYQCGTGGDDPRSAEDRKHHV